MSTLTQPSRPRAAPAPPAAPVAEFVRVTKAYRDLRFWRRPVPAVADVSFEVRPGEVFGLLGPNRAGKTTLVKILLTLCRADAGEVRRLGRPVGERGTLGQVGYVHENHAFPRYLSAAELLEFYGALSLVPADVLRQRVPRLLERVGLADRSAEPVARFSKGMLQRLGIAQALVNAPRLLVLDEPTEGLDLEGRQLLREVMADVKRGGGGVLLVSHALAEVEQVCDRVGVLVRGRLAHVGPLAELTRAGRPLEQALQALYAGRDA